MIIKLNILKNLIYINMLYFSWEDGRIKTYKIYKKKEKGRKKSWGKKAGVFYGKVFNPPKSTRR